MLWFKVITLIQRLLQWYRESDPRFENPVCFTTGQTGQPRHVPKLAVSTFTKAQTVRQVPTSHLPVMNHRHVNNLSSRNRLLLQLCALNDSTAGLFTLMWLWRLFRMFMAFHLEVLERLFVFNSHVVVNSLMSHINNSAMMLNFWVAMISMIWLSSDPSSKLINKSACPPS